MPRPKLAFRWQDISYEKIRKSGEEFATLVATHLQSGKVVEVPMVPARQTIPIFGEPAELDNFNLENNAKHEAFEKLGKMVRACSMPLAEDGRYQCQREGGHSGVHAFCFYHSGHFFLYTDATKSVHGHCQDCFEKITEVNRGKGWGSAVHCADCLPARVEEQRIALICPHCGSSGDHREHRNFNPVMRYADIYCGKCDTRVGCWDPN